MMTGPNLRTTNFLTVVNAGRDWVSVALVPAARTPAVAARRWAAPRDGRLRRSLVNSSTESWLSAARRAIPQFDTGGELLDVGRGVVVGGDPEYQFVAVAEHRDPGAQLQSGRRDRQQALHPLAHQPQPVAWPGHVGRQRHDATLR